MRRTSPGGIMFKVSTRWIRTRVDREEAPVSEAGEKNKALVRRFYEALTEGDLVTIRELLAPDFVDHRLLPGYEDPGREDHMAAEGDRVVSRLITSGVHDRGEFMGLAPTGKEYEMTVIVIHRIEEAKIAEEWTEGSDIATLTEQRLEQEMSERERVEQELRVARRIQHASLP